jgi:hypothetical protein
MRKMMAFLFMVGVVGCDGSPVTGPIVELDPANVAAGSEAEEVVDGETEVQLTPLEKEQADMSVSQRLASLKREAAKPGELIVSFSSGGDISLEEIASTLRGHSEWESLIRRSKKTVAPPSSLPPGVRLDPALKRLRWNALNVPRGNYEIRVFVIYVDNPKPKTSTGAKFQKKGFRGQTANEFADEKRKEWRFQFVVE